MVLIMAWGCCCCLRDVEQRTLWIEEEEDSATAIDSKIKITNSNRTLVLELFHKDSMASPFRRKDKDKVVLLAESLNADKERMLAIKQHRALIKNASAQLIQITNPTHMYFGGGQYVTQIGVGTPPRIATLLVDTGSQLTWLQCLPCSSTCVRREHAPIFDPSSSSSLHNVVCPSRICSDPRSATFCGPAKQCSYNHYYGKGNAYTKGNLVREVVTFSNWRVGNTVIGCTHDQSGNIEYGILGLSFGPLSFPNQILYQIAGKFSYCLSESKSTRLIFGDGSVPPAPTPTVFTSILQSPDDNLYYVDLARVAVGGARPLLLPQEETVQVSGTIIDSGSTQTYLVQPAYNIIRDIFRKQARDLGPLVPVPESFADNLDTCYNLFGRPSFIVPSVDFYFRDGAMLSLPPKNVLRRVPSHFGTAIYCFTFSPSFSDINIIGNQHQRGFRVSYDMINKRLGFSPSQC